ncbi:MAG: hypothetical protein ABW133_23850, partial [Polyangiaceae bacterium]
MRKLALLLLALPIGAAGLGACHRSAAGPAAPGSGDPSGSVSNLKGSTEERAGRALSDEGPKRATKEVTVYHLHKFLRKIGTERDSATPAPDGTIEWKANFGFQDRGNEVPLAAAFRVTDSGVIKSYEAWGSTSRMSVIDERAILDSDGSYVVHRLGEAPKRVKPQGPFAVASGYAPVLAQDFMLRKWIASGRPQTMALIPEGTLTIESRGKEPYPLEDKSVELEHVSVRGLAWGREDVWLDGSGKLIAVVTRDAEFDAFQAVREGYLALLPALSASAGADGVKWMSEVAKSAERPSSGVIALVGADLVDGTGKPAVQDAVVIYDRDKIVAAGPRAKITIPAGATTIDVTGKTILPGLWDMHAHFGQVEHGAAYLASGVTTVRDLGNVLEFITGVRDAIDAGKGLGPRILVDGLVDGAGQKAVGTIIIKSNADIVPVLDRLKKAGCLEVKIYSSIEPSLVKPIAVEAHKRGMRVVGHVPEGMDVVEALNAGFDGVSHAQYLFGPLFAPGEMSKLSRSTLR